MHSLRLGHRQPHKIAEQAHAHRAGRTVRRAVVGRNGAGPGVTHIHRYLRFVPRHWWFHSSMNNCSW